MFLFMNFKFECQNINPTQIYCTIDGVSFKCSKTKKGIVAQLTLNPGKHCLIVKKRTLYDTSLCYLNALNPIFFFYQWECIFNRAVLAYDESHAEIKIQIDIKEDVDASIVLDCKKTYISNSMYSSYSFICLNYDNMEIDETIKLNASKISIKRFKISNILSILFFSILTIIVSLIEIILHKSNIGFSVISCCVVLFFSMVFSYKVLNSRSMSSISKKIGKKRNKKGVNKHM